MFSWSTASSTWFLYVQTCSSAPGSYMCRLILLLHLLCKRRETFIFIRFTKMKVCAVWSIFLFHYFGLIWKISKHNFIPFLRTEQEQEKEQKMTWHALNFPVCDHPVITLETSKHTAFLSESLEIKTPHIGYWILQMLL